MKYGRLGHRADVVARHSVSRQAKLQFPLAEPDETGRSRVVDGGAPSDWEACNVHAKRMVLSYSYLVDELRRLVSAEEHEQWRYRLNQDGTNNKFYDDAFAAILATLHQPGAPHGDIAPGGKARKAVDSMERQGNH